jgi:hydroxymethylpyrimidine pyrophosphatase-like HAD family hydrolase
MRRDIRLVIADVDGTLVTQNKVLTPRAIEAVNRVRDAGIRFTITSGRPPLGMKMLVDALGSRNRSRHSMAACSFTQICQ